ncbi:EF-hand domain-containing protein [Poseidonocella sedimentorum]|uniref:Ca2+-binding protein, EF-hand superfamily n=1 Tax=Poseidonocella sedimentorum TaxID=871652 RepID=A0A1I6DYG4_9RHOB|nr:hypothetical protein [Poseidonocella sedimentorum]SFR10466.1 Ca2+-binding protein, EF-hand superfamily [Poseidonocella sedimentorum]
MTKRTLIPGLFLIAAVSVSGAAIATAQSATDTAPQTTEMPADGSNGGPERPFKAQMLKDHDRTRDHDRGERGDRGDRGERGERRGPGGFGKKGARMGGFGPMGVNVAAIFAEIDADGDKSITQADIDAYRADKVASVDASGDGALDIEEFDDLYRSFTRERMVDIFQVFDADGDGSVSSEELDARLGNVVERMDRDDDGALTLQDRAKRR